MREATRMHDKSASFVKGTGFSLLQDDGGVESVKFAVADLKSIVSYVS